MKAVLVTGNKNKLREFKSILGEDLENVKIDLEEIQSLDLKEICEYKAKQAYCVLQKPVLVEDTGFFIDELNGLPGPFIKFFEERLGNGAAIKLIGKSENRGARQECCVSYYDGNKMISVIGICLGTLASEMQNGEGFGFDFCFIPEGYNKTFSQLGLEEKNKISARKKAIEKLKEELVNASSDQTAQEKY